MRPSALQRFVRFHIPTGYRWIGGLLIIFSLTLLAGLLTVHSAPDDIIPRIVVRDPPPGLALPLNSPVSFIFNTAMDHASTQAALTVSMSGGSPISGSFVWPDDNTLEFTPATPLQRRTEYLFTFRKGAKSAAGQLLQGDDSFRAQTVGDLQVAQIIPDSGTKDVAGNSLITVIFNRPVVPLVSAEQQGTLPDPITISPPLSGAGTWINTSIYQFKPSQGLKGGATYTVTVKAGLTDQSGSTLPQAVSATFTTIAPQLTSIRESKTGQAVDGQKDIPRDPTLAVSFSQPMDHAATESSFRLTDSSGKTIDGVFIWNDSGFNFKPKSLLDYDTVYTASIDPKIALSSTGATLSVGPKDQVSATFNVISTPTLVSTTPGNGDSVSRTDFIFNFSGPMSFKDFMSHVSVSPKPGSLNGTGSDGDSSFTLDLGTDSSKYTVTFDPKGVTDSYGTPLRLDPKATTYTVLPNGKAQISYAIALQFPAEFSLQTADNLIGLYSAYAPQTRVYSTHRNVSQLSLSLSKVPDDVLLSGFSTPYGYDQTALIPSPANVLRTWQQTVENPAQALRYDLLPISASGPSVSAATPPACPDAPPSRVAVGQALIVLKDDPTPLNVRADHLTSASVITRLPVGTALKVINGPVCAGGYVWWRMTAKDPASSKAINGWVAEGDKAHYFIGPDPAQPAPASPTPLVSSTDAAGGALKPGAYFLSISTDATADSAPLQHVMIVGTANVVIKMSISSTTAWLTDLKTGLPVANVPIRFQLVSKTDYKAPAVVTSLDIVKTDANGLAVVQYPPVADLYTSAITALVDDGGQYALGSSTFSQGIEPYNFNLNADYAPTTSTVYLYSDRSLYKPGQPVYVKGVIRSKEDLHYRLINRKTIPVEVFDDKNQSIFKQDVPITAAGTFSTSFTLDARASLGYYQVVATLDDPTTKDDSGPQFSRAFSVAEYRPPEFQVNVSAAQPDVVQGDKVNVTVDSSYFFGGAVANAEVSWTLLTQDAYFNYSGPGNYSFFDYNEDAGPEGAPDSSNYGGVSAQGTGKTDAQGKFDISVPADLGKSSQSQQYTIEATLTDSSGQPVSGRAQVTVHAGQFYLGAAPETYVGAVNQPAKVNLIAVDWHSQPLSNTAIDVRTVERQWNSVQVIDPSSGVTSWQYDVKEVPLDSSKVTTGADGTATYSFTPTHAGDYKVYVTSTDARGNKVTSSTYVYIAGPDYVPWRETNDYTFTLKADKTSYHVGDTASLLIASPFQGAATALISIERGSLLKTEVLALSSNSTVYKLPIDASDAPNVFVSVLVVKGTDAQNPVPRFRIGMTQINVGSDLYKLNISVKPDKPSAGPRETVNYALHVSDYQGKPVSAELGVGLTDLSVLSLLPDTSTPILDFFYNQQSLSIKTASTLTIGVDERTQTVLNKVKGGGGGGPEGGIFQVRQLFVDTPLWKPAVMTDTNGDATVSVQLPDQLTTWRLDARAITMPGSDPNAPLLVGQTTFDLISTKPLLIRPLTPRFYVQGDQGIMAAIVNNNTGADQQVTVRIDASGVTLGGPATQTVSIANNAQARIEWSVTVQQVDKVGVTFSASTADGKYGDAAKSPVGQGDDKTLPVYTYTAPETVSTAGVIAASGGSVTEGLLLPKDFDPKQGALDLNFAPSLAAALLDSLKAYPTVWYYDNCTEATVSRFLPNIATDQALTTLQTTNTDLHNSLQTQVNQDFQTLYSEQHVDGGWGVCFRDDSSANTSAYVLLGLVTAQQNNYNVDPNVIASAIKYLQGQIKAVNNLSETWQLNQQAFILYVLSQAGAGSVSDSVNLFSVRVKLSIYARAYLALDLFQLKDNSRVTTLIADLQSSAITSASGQHWIESYSDFWNWNTDTRTTAIVLDALVEIQPNNALIPNTVRWLMVTRQSQVWETTQETVWSILALSRWMQHSGELTPNYSFKATLNDRSIVGDTAITSSTVRTVVTNSIPLADLQPSTVNKLLITRTSGAGLLYYSAHLTSYLPAAQIKALDRGITLTRKYSLAADPKQAPITQTHVGDQVRVTLTIVTGSDLHYVMLTDPLPAGAEAIDPQINTSSSVGTQPSLNTTDPFGNGWGWWFFGDTQFRDEATVLSAEFLPAGTYEYTYLQRTGLAGTYNVIPATIQEQYFPEVYGRSDGALLTLLPATNPASDPTQVTPTAIPVPTTIPTPAR